MSTLQDLTRMDQIPVGMTLDGIAALRNQQARDQIGLDELVRKQAHESQMDPLRVQQQELANQQQGFLNQKTGFELGSLSRKDSMERNLFGPQQELALKKLLTEAGEQETKMFEKTLYDKLRSVRPGSPEHGALMKALESTRGFVEEKRKTDQKLREIDRTYGWQRTINQDNIDAGKYNRNKVSLTLEDRLLKAKSASERRQLLIDAGNYVEQNGDATYAAQLRQRANDPALVQQSERELDARRREGGGGVDLSRVGGGIPTITPPPTTTAAPLPVPAPAAAPATSPKTPQEAQAAGWKLMRDKNGNKAYVGPNGQYVEVK